MLNNPGEELVLSDGFLSMVERLDSCLTYLKSHVRVFPLFTVGLKLLSGPFILDWQRDFRDAEIYLIRYQQCMTRSMTLIKLYVVNALRALAQEVNKRVSDNKVRKHCFSHYLNDTLIVFRRSHSTLSLKRQRWHCCIPNSHLSLFLYGLYWESLRYEPKKIHPNWVHC
jgi:hypothetical protein